MYRHVIWVSLMVVAGSADPWPKPTMQMFRLWKVSDDSNVCLSVKDHIYFHPCMAVTSHDSFAKQNYVLKKPLFGRVFATKLDS